MLSLRLARHTLILVCPLEPGHLCSSSAACGDQLVWQAPRGLHNSSHVPLTHVIAWHACVAEAFAGIDSGDYAVLAAQLGVLQQLAALSKQTWTSPVAACVSQTLLNLVSAVITAFELSPFTLPADQLQATTDILVGLYDGRS